MGGGGVNFIFFFIKTMLFHFMFSSRFMLFPTFLGNKIFWGGGGCQKYCGVSVREISGDRVALFEMFLASLKCKEDMKLKKELVEG